MNEKKEVKKVDIKLQKVEVPKVDYVKYVGKKAKIGAVDTCVGEFGYYLQISTTPIDVVPFGKEQKEIRATRIFSLLTDKEGKVGWGETGKLVDLMNLKNVKEPMQLLGKEVVIQMELSKQGRSFLSFI
jgi:hypothetical protein